MSQKKKGRQVVDEQGHQHKEGRGGRLWYISNAPKKVTDNKIVYSCAYVYIYIYMCIYRSIDPSMPSAQLISRCDLMCFARSCLTERVAAQTGRPRTPSCFSFLPDWGGGRGGEGQVMSPRAALVLYVPMGNK